MGGKSVLAAILIMDFNNIFQLFQIVDSMTIFLKALTTLQKT